jgi:hypothetical protein
MNGGNRRTFLKQAGAALALSSAGVPRVAAQAANNPGDVAKGAVRAVDFESRPVYHSPEHPGYACWVSFFPGEAGQWYLTCERVTRPAKPYPRASREAWYGMSLPNGYDKAPLQMTIVMLESRDDMKTWKVISEQPVRYQHSAGSFGQARTKDGRFLRFVWACYSLEPGANAGEILYASDDNGKTWQKQPEFHDPRFASTPHRLRTLRDGTLVLALHEWPRWGPGTDRPRRSCVNLNAVTDACMNLCFSHDQGRTWTSPLPIYAGRAISETDFVELPSGDLLCINNSIFADPGRQIIHRTKHGFVPGAFERSYSKLVPETVAMTEDGLLVGCMRNSSYAWSDDLGLTWFPLEGIPESIAKEKETYQPWIQYLGNGRFANAGHYGHDNFYGELDQYVMIHSFRVEQLRRTKNTHIDLVRAFDEAKSRWKNAYTLTLTCDGQPLAWKELEFWFVERGKPGYDEGGKMTLEERMKTGGETIRVSTGGDGTAHVAIPRLDAITYIHHDIQLVARFNADRRDPDYKPAQTLEFQFYSNQVY